MSIIPNKGVYIGNRFKAAVSKFFASEAVDCPEIWLIHSDFIIKKREVTFWAFMHLTHNIYNSYLQRALPKSSSPASPGKPG